MVNITSQVFSEVYDIIYHLENELFTKIPEKFVELIKQNRDDKYEVNIDYSKSLIDQDIQRGTKVILALIYRDYLCSEEKRKELIEKYRQELKEAEVEVREKYKIDNLFKNKKNEVEEKNNDVQTSMITYKETVWQKIIKKFKQWFHI